MTAALAICGIAAGCGGGAAPVETEATARLEIVGGDGQEGVSPGYGYVPIGPGAMPESLRVRVTNEAGQPLAGRTVTWLVTTGGSVSPTTSITGSDGTAATRWWLHSPAPAARATSPGTHMVRATVAGAPPVDFTGDVRTGIRIDELLFTPDTVDVGSGPVPVTVSARVHDDRRQTSLEYGSVHLLNPSATAEAHQSVLVSLTLTSGTPNDGVWSATFELPAHAEPGAWYLGRLTLGWGCGGWNRMELTGATLTRHALARTVYVVRTATGTGGGASAAGAALTMAAPSRSVAAAGC